MLSGTACPITVQPYASPQEAICLLLDTPPPKSNPSLSAGSVSFPAVTKSHAYPQSHAQPQCVQLYSLWTYFVCCPLPTSPPTPACHTISLLRPTILTVTVTDVSLCLVAGGCSTYHPSDMLQAPFLTVATTHYCSKVRSSHWLSSSQHLHQATFNGL